MHYNIVVATHHKAGTVWMSTVFKAIATGLGVNYVDFWSRFDDLERHLEKPFILFNHDSMFSRYHSLLAREDVRVLHLIRDPRDILVSAVHYHLVAKESWLTERFSGRAQDSYQARLNRIPSSHERFLFELDRATGSVIRQMLEWRYDRPNCFEARYEALRTDSSMTFWAQATEFLGLTPGERRFADYCLWNRSLFGRVPARNRRHVRSGSIAQWRQEFSPELGHAFVERFPTALQKLGYESDDSWLEELAAIEVRLPSYTAGIRK